MAVIQPDLICFSHLRWNFVYQRPQHLMSRFAKCGRVFFVEEPFYDGNASSAGNLEVRREACGVMVCVPHLPPDLLPAEILSLQTRLIGELIAAENVTSFIAWYYTPMALSFTQGLQPMATVYDCMDELSGFLHAPPELAANESLLFQKAAVVFTGGRRLYEAKRHRHPNIHARPSGVDLGHFAQARTRLPEPEDQKNILGLKLGFFGVIDERFDIALLQAVAAAEPAWQFIIIGPVVKIDPSSLPVAPNIHYLGGKSYQELPNYLAHWDVALLLFERNEATRFISPTKTPEYLAAGKPVISTSIYDVVRPYGDLGLVEIADTPQAFIAAANRLILQQASPLLRKQWLEKTDRFLVHQSWDGIWAAMQTQMLDALEPTAATAASTASAASAVSEITKAAISRSRKKKHPQKSQSQISVPSTLQPNISPPVHLAPSVRRAAGS